MMPDLPLLPKECFGGTAPGKATGEGWRGPGSRLALALRRNSRSETRVGVEGP